MKRRASGAKLPSLSEETRREIEQQIADYGLGAVIAAVRALRPEPPARGRDNIDDDERLVRMAQHLDDPDLKDRLLNGDAGVLGEAARRAINNIPRPGDLTKTGAATAAAVKRLVRKFDYFCFDVGDRRGFDRGRWAVER